MNCRRDEFRSKLDLYEKQLAISSGSYIEPKLISYYCRSIDGDGLIVYFDRSSLQEIEISSPIRFELMGDHLARLKKAGEDSARGVNM